MIVSEWVKQKCQITKVNADANQGTDLFIARQKMLLTSVSVRQERGPKETAFDQLSTKYRYESGWGDTYPGTSIEISDSNYSRPHQPENRLSRLYLPEVWLWIGRGSDWYSYHVVKKVDGQKEPFNIKIEHDFVMNANDKVYAFINWPKLVYSQSGEPQQSLTARQQEQINSHVGELHFHIQGVRA